MRISYDPSVEATYVTITDAQVTRTIEVSDVVMIDVDADGNTVGIELAMRSPEITKDIFRAALDRANMSIADERTLILDRVVAAIRHRAGRVELADPSPDGLLEIVIALRSDKVSDICAEVRDAGGLATVIVPGRDDMLAQLVLEMGRDRVLPVDENDCVHPDSTMGAIADYLETETGNDPAGFSFFIEDVKIVDRRTPLMQIA